MVCAQLLLRRAVVFPLPWSSSCSFSVVTRRSQAFHRIAKLRPLSRSKNIYPQTLHSPIISRSLTTTPARRKDQAPDDIPKAIPVKEVTNEQEKKEQVLEEQTEGAKDAKKVPDPPSGSNVAPGDGSSPKSGAAGGAGGESGSGAGEGGGRRGRKASSERAISKPSIPEVYPQVMAIPIAKRPLFPGFYKAITVRDPNVIAAVQEMLRRGQPYVGAFLFKDEGLDKDVIDSMDEVHDVGVFAQITSAFPVTGETESLTVVLYPHRRIKVSQLIPPKPAAGSPAPPVVEVKDKETKTEKEAKPSDEKPSDKPGDVVASFEESNASPDSGEPPPYEPTAFLRDFPISLVNVTNMVEQSYDKNSPFLRAVTSEIVSVFREVANLNHLFRDQISTFTLTQSAGNVHDEPAKLADFAAAVSSGEVKELQDCLQTMNIEERLSKALMVLKNELMNAQLQSKISKDVENKIQKRQREYWLMEQ